ncbi:MAG: OB-fold domain-containing protein [Burkholderiales bacterium]|nr:OB-fold domain-containing protein [Burkholderiales bacterium]MDE2394001.1 OB-fold domain-containing protein [Burkholderiales bacterium]MDE2453125.1 OB-fold domain-containing protein [Burkholderiales bacterium]
MDFPKPEIGELNRPYWDALREGHLVVQRCDQGHAWLPARRHCPACLSDQTRWERASGEGRLLSWVVYHQAYHPAFESRLPYNVALVELDEGPRLLTNVADAHDRLRAEARVRLKVEWEGDLALARFRLAESDPPRSESS